VFFFLSLGVLDPQLNAINFDKLTLQSSVTEISTANPYNQLTWLALAALASLPVLRQPARLLRASSQVWPVLLLFAFCLLSATWSDYPEVSARRAFGLILPAYCLLASITYVDRAERAVRIVYLAFWAALLLNLAVFPLPAAFDEFGFFRGAAGNKNAIGSLAALAILFGISMRNCLNSTRSQVACVVYLVAWGGLLFLSVSKTSLALVLLVPPAFYALKALSHFLRLDLMLVIIGGSAFALVVFAIIHYGTGIAFFDVVHIFWPDASFTGRTPIWTFMLSETSNNWLVGTGFGSFWATGYNAPNLRSIYGYIQLINQAHHGYLDIFATLGIFGLVLLFIVFQQFSLTAERLRSRSPSLLQLVWFIVLFAFVHNLMESSLLMPFNSLWHMMLFAIFIAARAAAEDTRVWQR